MLISPDITTEELQVFLLEADEQIQTLDEDIVALEKDSANAELIQEIFRAAHTLKGSSAMLGHARLADVAHAMETLLDKLRKGEIPCAPEIIDALLRAIDAIRTLKEELTSGTESDVAVSEVVASLEAAGTANPSGNGVHATATSAAPDAGLEAGLKAAAERGELCWKVTISVDPQSPWAAVRMFQAVHEASGLGSVPWSRPSVKEIEAEKVGTDLEMVVTSNAEEREVRAALSDLQDVLQVKVEPYAQANGSLPAREEEPSPPAHAAEQKAEPSSNGKGAQTIKIEVAMLDKFMDLVSELVIERSRVNQVHRDIRARYGDTEEARALNNASLNIYKVVDELHYGIMKVRMLPISTVFNSLPRIVRDISRQEGKQAEIRIEGKETELDRAVIERLRDPLLHILRNAVDHGLETPEERRAAGKPPAGIISLVASQEQESILVKISDDGRGINVEKLKQAALRKGLITQEAAAAMSDEEATHLMFLSGLTTKEKVTEVSGRGVGMDIVKTNLEAIGGSVDIQSWLGKGTTFTLKLPLTLAIIQGFLVSSNAATYVVPILSVVETMKRKDANICMVMGRETVRFRDSIIPLRSIDALTEGAACAARSGNYIVLLRSGGRTAAVGVDDLLEPQEVVVKPMGQYLSMVRAFSGATIMGNGSVALILDVPTIISAALGSSNGGSEAG
ncbi:MAG: chemotaxis protein CheA [Chloroflexi bacterium]|nr:chemotaxis protein CheA [Chloroflexota bacterium]